MNPEINQFIKTGNAQKIENLVSHNNIKFNRENSPLNLAISSGDIQIINTLIEAGCNVEWGGALEPPPLCFAVEEEKSEVVKLLIEKQAKLNRKDEIGFTPLMSAAAIGNFEIVKILVESGAKVNIENDEGDFALRSAITNGHYKIYEYLLPLTSARLRKKIETKFFESLHRGKKQKKDKNFKKLLAVISEVDLAIMRGRSKREEIEKNAIIKIKEILPKITNFCVTDKNNYTVIHHANSKPTILKFLLKNGFINALNIQDDDGNTALISSCIENQIKSVQVLLDVGANPEIKNQQGNTALISTVIFSKSNEIIQLLYDAGANLETQDKFGNSAIDVAYYNSKLTFDFYELERSQENVVFLKSLGASTSRFAIIDFIDSVRQGNNNKIIEYLENGGKIDSTAIGGVSAISVALANNKIETFKLLLARGASLKGKDVADAFIQAVYLGHIEIVIDAIEHSVDVNQPGQNGIYALTRAVEKNNTEIVKILLKSGAKLPDKENNGDILKDSKSINPEIYKLLVKYFKK
ncbi:ankyrin repeat domain-containing protein [Lusitaniella coriacea]|uniref:ankyrin repeat domain-containing protein n=1 Tax=Lusitaniella coriacea TaxID=1983105 RepID=UPI003CEC7AF8